MIMKAKKHFGISTTVFCVCALLVFNFFIFPDVLAASPENRGIETITTETAPPAMAQSEVQAEPDIQDESDVQEEPGVREQPDVQEEPAKQDEPDVQEGIDIQEGSFLQESVPSINAISKERAIEIAKGDGFMPSVTYEYGGAVYHSTTTVIGAKYIESDSPASDPSWFILFGQIGHGEYSISVPEGYTAEEYLAHLRTMDDIYFGSENMALVTDWDMVESGVDSDGKPVLIYHDITPNHYMVELNALTGAYISGGGLLGEAGGTLDITVLEKFMSEDFNIDDFQPNPTLGPIDTAGTAKG